MILDYNVGDQVMYRHYGTYVSGEHPARVTLVHHQDDGNGAPYTRIEIITYTDQRVSLMEPQIKTQLRKRTAKDVYATVDTPVKYLVNAWEDVDGHTRRLKVREGWIYKGGEAMCFVPGNLGRAR